MAPTGHLKVGVMMTGNYSSWVRSGTGGQRARNYPIELAVGLGLRRWLRTAGRSGPGTNGAGILMGATTGCLVEGQYHQ